MRSLDLSLSLVILLALGQADDKTAALRIVSPANGTIVHPGQKIAVSVTSTDPTVMPMMVVGADPIPFIVSQTGVPAEFTVPIDIACGTYTLTAMGRTSSGKSVVGSVPVTIDVERPDLPVSISASMASFTFEEPGETSRITLVAKFSDGRSLDVTTSSHVSYSSFNPSVFAVDSTGIVTAGAPGYGLANVTYTLDGRKVQAQIRVTVLRSVLAPSAFSLSFGTEGVGTQSAPQRLTFTNTTPGPVRIVEVKITGNFSETDDCTALSPLPKGGSCRVNVSFASATTGPRLGKLTVSNLHTGSSAIIPLTGTGR